MATPELTEAATKVVAEPMFGLLDILLMSVSLGIGVYWFFFRGKKSADQSVTAIKKLTLV